MIVFPSTVKEDRVESWYCETAVLRLLMAFSISSDVASEFCATVLASVIAAFKYFLPFSVPSFIIFSAFAIWVFNFSLPSSHLA